MGGVIVVAIIVILCFIIWKKNQGKNTPAIEKSMESREKVSDEKLHKAEDLKNLEDSEKSFEVREEQKYDGSRKKDRGKKRREKRRAEAEEIKEAPATKVEDKKVEAKAEKVEKPAEKVEPKVEKVEPKIEEAKAKVNEPVKKLEPKVEKLEAKAEAKKEAVKPVEKSEAKTEKAPEKTQAKAEKIEKPVEKVEPKIEEAKAKVNEPVKKVEPKVEKVEAKVEKIEAKPEAKEKIEKPMEKSQAQKIISTNEKYSHIIKALGENPWELASEKINIKLEDLKTKKPLDENYSLDDIKKSLTRENLSEFLNMVKTNPTILKRKDKVTYEFTIKNPDEIKKIAERYSLSASNFEKASSLLTVDKESAKLLEVTDILTEGEKRIYIETKF